MTCKTLEEKPFRRVALLAGIALLAALSMPAASASSLRCDNKLALPGDTRFEVRTKCGNPSDVVHSTLVRRSSIVVVQHAIHANEELISIPVEIWTYNFGPHRFMQRLRFVNGILESVETLGYGVDEAPR
jgi:hypothetical protein